MTADDANSEDLFITQKKFRVVPSSDHSGSGGTGEAIATSVPRHTKSPLQPKRSHCSGSLHMRQPLKESTSLSRRPPHSSAFTSRVELPSAQSNLPTCLARRMRAKIGLHCPSSPRKVNDKETRLPLGQKSTDTISSK